MSGLGLGRTRESVLGSAGIVVPAILALTALVYLQSLPYPFQFDDQLFLRDGNVQQGRWTALLWPANWRPLTWATFSIQYAVWGPNPVAFHLLNLLLHLANVILAYLVLISVGRLLSDESGTQAASAGGALLATMLFALHPLQTQSVAYAYQRSTLLSGLFMLVAVLLWTRPEGTIRNCATLVCFAAAVASKESALILPLILYWIDLCARERERPSPLLGGILLVSLAGALAYLWGRPDQSSLLQSSLSYASSQILVIPRYLFLFVWPSGQSVDPWVDVSLRFSPYWWASLVFLLGWICAGLLLLTRRRLLSFWLLAVLFLLAPTSSIAPSRDLMFEHRVYLPLLAMAAVTASLVCRVPWPSAGGTAGALLLTGGISLLTLQRLAVWESPETLWRDAVGKAPAKYRPLHNLGTSLIERSPGEAERFLVAATRQNPALPLAYRSLGRLKRLQGDQREALRYWSSALALDPDHAQTMLAVGRLRIRGNDFAAARSLLERTIAIHPQLWEAPYLLSQLYLRFGMVGQALEVSETGLRLHPGAVQLRLALADSVRRQANWERAIELYRQAIREAPGQRRAFTGLAESYSRAGKKKEAIEAATRALDLAESPSHRQQAEGLLELVRSQPE